jgi:hypothetical protein
MQTITDNWDRGGHYSNEARARKKEYRLNLGVIKEKVVKQVMNK